MIEKAKCKNCEGKGAHHLYQILPHSKMLVPIPEKSKTCQNCQGSGRSSIFCDQDMVLCNFQGAFEVKRSFTLPFPQSIPGFFLDLEPLPGAIETFKELQKFYDVWILTRPSIKNLHCYSEKAEWCSNYFGEEILERLIICPNKSKVIGDYLIDDDDRYGQLGFRGEFLQFGKAPFYGWEEIRKYFLG